MGVLIGLNLLDFSLPPELGFLKAVSELNFEVALHLP